MQHIQKTGFTGITIEHNTEMMYFLDKKLKNRFMIFNLSSAYTVFI